MVGASQGPGNTGSVANALVLEALIEVLRRKGLVEPAEIESLFLAAAREAARLPPGHVNPHRVRELIDALAARARGRASLAAAPAP